MIKTTFSHIGLTCQNPAKIEDFYCKYFGFKRVYLFLPGPDQIVILKSNDMHMELFRAQEERTGTLPLETGTLSPGFRHICFLVDNIEEKLDEMRDEIRVTKATTALDFIIPGMRSVWFADPEGNIVELTEGYKD